jgi:hypothetical protein
MPDQIRTHLSYTLPIDKRPVSETTTEPQATALGDQKHFGTPAEVSGWNSVVGATTAASRLLDDGTIVEIIRDPQTPFGLKFLLWKNGIATIVKQVEHNRQIILPPRISAPKIEALTLPTGAQTGSLAKDLVEEIATTISLYVDLSENALRLVTHHVLYTWTQERLAEATYLWLVGPLGSGKTALLRVLNCLCRHALLVGDAARASLISLANELQPTFIIDECEFCKSSAPLLRFLRATSSQDISLVHKGELYKAFGTKVLASRQPPMDAALRSRAIFVSMAPTNRDLLPFDSKQAANVKEQFQNRLLAFRLGLYHRLPIPHLTQTLAFTPRMRSIARALVFPVQGDNQMVAKLLDILSQEDDVAKMDRAVEPEWLAVEALFDLCHERHAGPPQDLHGTIVFVGGVTKCINEKLETWGADTTYTARAIGAVLRSIGVQTKKFGSFGYGVRLSAAFRRKVHTLAKQYGITRRDIATPTRLEQGFAGWACSVCDKFDLRGGLKWIEPPKAKADSGPGRRSRPRTRPPLFAKQDPIEENPQSPNSVAFHAPNPEPVAE